MEFCSHSEWSNDSKIQVIQYSSVLVSVFIRGILQKKNGRDTIINADASNTELLFRIIQWFALVFGIVRKGLSHFDNCIPTSSPHLSQFFPMFGSYNLIPLCTSLCGHLGC